MKLRLNLFIIAYIQKVEDQLRQRRVNLQSIVKAASELMESSNTREEKTRISNQVATANEAFEKVKIKCEQRSTKLADALRDVIF